METLSKAPVREDFQDWLEGERADPQDVSAVLAEIESGLFPLLDYNQFKLADESSCSIEFDPVWHSLKFRKGLDALNLALNSGQCGELVAKAILLIRQKYPELANRLMMIKGNDSQFFQPGTHHYFAALADSEEVKHDLLNERQFSKGDSLWVIDPALKNVGLMSDLGYSVAKRRERHLPLIAMMRRDFSLAYIPQFTPFARDSSGRLVHFGWLAMRDRSEPSDRIRMGIQESGEEPEWVPTSECDVDPTILAQFQRLQERVSRLRF
jgi:hypothetical protein